MNDEEVANNQSIRRRQRAIMSLAVSVAKSSRVTESGSASKKATAASAAPRSRAAQRTAPPAYVVSEQSRWNERPLQ